MGVGFLLFVGLLGLSAYRFARQPVVVMDERRLWGQSVLRINSINDALLIRRVPFPLNSIYWLRLRMYGAPMIVPELKGITPDEFCALMEQHRDRAK
jgi:hypothetical protein